MKKEVLLLVVGILVTIYVTYWAYWPWVKPDQYILRMKKPREKIAKRYPYLPQNLNYKIFKKYPLTDIWGARVVSLLAFFLSVLFLLAIISSPNL